MASEHFVKVYGTILDSSIWYEKDATRILWITMLAMADSTGYIEAATPGLAGRARISLEDCEESLTLFQSPDKHSKNQEYEGRRVEKVDRGWQLLNYQDYRDMRTEAQVKRAERQARWRAGVIERERLRVAAVGDGVDGVDVKETTSSRRERLHNAQKVEGRGERGEGRISSSQEREKKALQPDIDRYYIACTIALNHGMQENPTIEGEWMPVTASSQVARVTWCEDEIPLGIVEEIILKRSKAYRCSAQNRGPRSLKYFDRAVRETWERGQQSASDAKVSEVLSR